MPLPLHVAFAVAAGLIARFQTRRYATNNELQLWNLPFPSCIGLGSNDNEASFEPPKPYCQYSGAKEDFTGYLGI